MSAQSDEAMRLLREIHAMRFWSRVDFAGLNDCWPWKGRVNWAGYGSFSALNKEWRSNRVAWMIANGAIGDGLVVCHTCDVPVCCNPAHLFLGTMDDNCKDRDTKRRGVPPRRVFGEDTTAAVLSADDVREIRRRSANGEPQVSIAQSFPVGKGAISKIVRRERWTHI